MSIAVTDKHLAMAEKLVAKARANDGLAPVDMDRFWADQAQAEQDPFGADIPQVPSSLIRGLYGGIVFDELGIPENMDRYTNDREWTIGLHKTYNDKAIEIIGIRPLSEESAAPPDHAWPPTMQLHDVFEARNIWQSGSWWLHQSADNEDELARLLDRVEDRIEQMRPFMLPENWAAEKSRLTGLGLKVPLYRGQRGPITFATSVYGVENLIFLINDNPDLAARFRDAILNTILTCAAILDEEAGYTPETAPHGWAWCDDNCYVLSPGMYDFFGYPIAKGVFDRYCPRPEDRRYQHSDSAMGHIVPILARLNLTGVNFGPTVTVREIREHMPTTRIDGQLAPFTLSRNNEISIVAEFCRDFEMARESRGLNFTTAGSINNGTRLTGARLIMSAIQEYGRYD